MLCLHPVFNLQTSSLLRQGDILPSLPLHFISSPPVPPLFLLSLMLKYLLIHPEYDGLNVGGREAKNIGLLILIIPPLIGVTPHVVVDYGLEA